ncbi:MAG: tetratricopeptide repeat protein, partial [Planctomycetota bacterium]
MSRTHLVLLLILATAVAAPGKSVVERLLEAQKLEGEVAPGEPRDLALQRAFQAYGEISQKFPDRWEPFMVRGANRCLLAQAVTAQLAARLNGMRARGADAARIGAMREHGQKFINDCLTHAYGEFRRAEIRMRKSGETDPERLVFANAAMKFAKGEYLEASNGERGAIGDLKALLKTGFQPRVCNRMVAESYNDLGSAAYNDEDYVEAHKYWDKALEYAKSPRLRRIIITNKAGAHEMDNEFDLAEKLLRDLCVREPFVPDHWKNLGMLLGYEARFKPALHAYAECRRICRETKTPYFLGIEHGNAWLRAAMIHGKLLREEGDIHMAWRLFLEYRKHFGDDYNLSIAFGEFAMHMGAYDISFAYLS